MKCPRRQVHWDRKQVIVCWGREELRITANRSTFPFWGDRHVLDLGRVTVAPHCEYTQNYWIVHFEMVNFMLHEFNSFFFNTKNSNKAKTKIHDLMGLIIRWQNQVLNPGLCNSRVHALSCQKSESGKPGLRPRHLYSKESFYEIPAYHSWLTLWTVKMYL